MKLALKLNEEYFTTNHILTIRHRHPPPTPPPKNRPIRRALMMMRAALLSTAITAVAAKAAASKCELKDLDDFYLYEVACALATGTGGLDQRRMALLKNGFKALLC